MAAPVILLGAGASIDAGLPDTFRLTEAIYDELKKPSYGKQGVLFGYIISKIRSRRVMNGGSPFDRVNVEEAYDTLLRVLNKNQDILADFASGWDPIFDFMRPDFDEGAFMRGVVESIQDQRRRQYDGIISIDQHRLREASRAIANAVNGVDQSSNAARVASLYLGLLVDILANPSSETAYIDSIVEYASISGGSVATLNYDLLFEESCGRKGLSWDYGLSRWNSRQITEWQRAGLKLFKLHGSINWSGTQENIKFNDSISGVDRWRRPVPLMIFGGMNGKLTPDGPFLQLRNDFERNLLKSNRLLIIGYSFGDAHINSIIRKWVATKNKTKLVILDPGKVEFGMDIFRNSYDSDAKKPLCR